MSSSSVSSQTWLQNFRPYVNGVKVRWPDLYLNLMAGECIDLTLEFEFSYLIGDPESPLKLCCEPDAESLGLVCDPPFGQRVEMAEGLIELTWHICASQTASEPFELHFEMPLFEEMPHSPKIPGSVFNFERELELSFDSYEINLENGAFPCHGAQHTLTVRPRPSSHFLNTYLHFSIEGDNPGVVFDPPLPTPRLLTPEGVSSTLDCLKTSRNAEFRLQLISEKSGLLPFLIRMSLAHNKVTVERWRKELSQNPDTPLTEYGIRAMSPFLNRVVGGVRVDIYQMQVIWSKETDANGEVIVVSGGRPTALVVHNKYGDEDV
jgi:hypothetical protein